MKKKVKQYGRQIEVGSIDRKNVLKDFSRMLDSQVWFIKTFHVLAVNNTYSNSL